MKKMVEAVHPLRIILFGSAARGDMRPDSDIDLLIVMPEGANCDEVLVLPPRAMKADDADWAVSFAIPANTPGLSDAKKMEILTRKTAAYLPRVDFIGHYTALQALKRGSGDCTESAALLAALGRAAGIATRGVG